MGSMGGSIGANIGSLWFNRISGTAVDIIGAAGGDMGSPTGSIGIAAGENMGPLIAQSAAPQARIWVL